MSTIVAISTAPGIGGIGIIRMSGKECFNILNKIFIPKNKYNIEEIEGYTLKYGNIINPQNKEIIDEVIVSFFKEPKSYTTENMCEINSHGSNVIIKQILELCLKNGATLAMPGEFTKRAFLNGRIDLSQAEAIIDTINSKTEKESQAAINQLEGFLSKEIKEIKSDIINLMADIEANIDYPEYDIEEVTNLNILKVLDISYNKLKKLEKSFDTGKILKNGITTAIIGKPNVGKSSLLNKLLKEDRAIVTNIEGTTRDTIEEFISIEGIPLKIIDTAGIRNAENEIEKIGINKSIEIANKADLVIAIFDITREITKEDKEIIKIIKDKKAIILLNKIDLKENKEIPTEIKEINKPIILTSTTQNKGLDELYNEIIQMFNIENLCNNGENIIVNLRHKELITEAIENIEKVKESINNNMPLDISAIYIKEILDMLNNITGESTSEEIIKEIFSKFCLGK